MPHLPYTPDQISRIETFTGPVSAGQLQYVHSFVGRHMAMFMPVAGPCRLAVTPSHVHPAYMFIINFSNSTSVVMGNVTYRAEANLVSFLPPNVSHHEVNDAAIPRYVAVFVEPAFLREQAGAYNQLASGLDGWCTFDCPEELLHAVKRFIAECKNPKPGSELLLDALSVELVHIMLRAMLGIKAANCAHASRIEINRAIEYMRQNLSEKLSLPVLAAFANMSVSHFARVFKQETGLSPIDYLIEMRLEVACQMLLGANVPLKEIALDCGFSSAPHFSSSFQKKYKLAPSEYLNASLLK